MYRNAVLLLWLMGTSCTTLDSGDGGYGAPCMPIEEQGQRTATDQDESVLKSSSCVALSSPNTLTPDAGSDAGAANDASR